MSIKPKWIIEAEKLLNTLEIKGHEHNEKILQLWKDVKLSGIKNDETAWCSAFVGAMFERCQIRSTRSDSSKSWTSWGFKLNNPTYGCVVVFWRNNPNSGLGHVGFVVGKDQKGNLMVLGGNQGDKVSIKPFSKDRVLGYRWPASEVILNKISFEDLPLLNSDGKLSNNES